MQQGATMRATTMETFTIAPHRFAVGYHRQTWWNGLIGSAFFFGEIGAGLFLISSLTGHWLGMAVGYLIVMVGKNSAHLLYLGRAALAYVPAISLRKAVRSSSGSPGQARR